MLCPTACHESNGMGTDFSRTVDALPGVVWTARPDGQLDFVNQRWCEYTGLGFDDACDEGWQTAIHPDDRPMAAERWGCILDSSDTGEIEARLRRSDGEYHWFVFRARPLSDESGQIVKWCGLGIDVEDRRRSEEAQRGLWWLSAAAREQQFCSIANDVPNLATLALPDGAIEMVNRQALDYFGTTHDEIKGRGIAKTVHPEDLQGALAAWTGAVKTGHTYDVESRLRRADGAYRWFHTRGFALRDTQGCPVFWYILQTDIDDRKRAEALLAGEKQFLEMVAGGRSATETLQALCHLVESSISGSYCSVLLVDSSGTRFEHAVAPSLPVSFTGSIVGLPVDANVGPCGMAASHNEQVVASDLKVEARWQSSGFRQLALDHQLQACWSTPILSRAGNPLGAFATYYNEPKKPSKQDQSLIERLKHIASIAVERVQSDTALRQSEAFLAQGQRLTSTGSFLWRVATGEITWSHEIYRMFEFDLSVPITLKLIATRVHPDDMPLMEDMLGRSRGDGSDFEYEHRLQFPDRRVKYLHMVGHGIRDQDDRLEYIGAVQDVTERRLSEEALSRVRSELAHVARVASLGALTASIAHEVNQPLSGIITNASTCLRMLATDTPDVAGARETARRTIRDGNRAADVIARLRALFAKKEAATEPVNLNEAAREVIALSLSELQRDRVIVRLELADNLPSVTGDRVQLQQVILNLIRNGAEAMSGVDDRPRFLMIRTERDEGERVRLTVQDAGAGFESQGAEKLFEAFYTTKSTGMGIGLSVSRSIIENHRGRLWAAPNEGPGAAFSFSIPRRLEAMPAADYQGFSTSSAVS